MNIPEDLRYSREHEWVRVDRQRRARRHHRLRAGQPRRRRVRAAPRRRHSTSSRARACQRDRVDEVGLRRLRARSPGTVTAVNDALADTPELVNQDPYGAGWMFEIELTDPASSTRCSTPRPTAPSSRADAPTRRSNLRTLALGLRSRARCRLGPAPVACSPCSAPAADIRTRRTPGSARRAARRSRPTTRRTTLTLSAVEAADRRGRARALPRRAAARRRAARRPPRPERGIVVPARGSR